MLLSFFPFSHIFTTISPNESTKSMFLVVFIPRILNEKNTLPSMSCCQATKFDPFHAFYFFSSPPRIFDHPTKYKFLNWFFEITLAMNIIVIKLTLILRPISKYQFSSPMFLTFFVLTLIMSTIRPALFSLAVLLIVFPVSGVLGTVIV